MHFVILGGGGFVTTAAGQVMGAIPPEAGQRGGIAEVVGHALKECLFQAPRAQENKNHSPAYDALGSGG
jgi:hypothetical protein